MLSRTARVCVLVALLAISAGADPATAQTPPEASRFRLGPLGLEPRVSLTNVGIDTNVLNDADNPRKDFTLTFVPELGSSLRAGRTLLTGRSGAEVLYFAKTSSQRSIAFSQEGRIDVVLARVTPFALAGRTETNQRPNAEIDARVSQTQRTLGAGVLMNIGSRTSLELQVTRRSLEFDNEVVSNGFRVADSLNRQTDTGRASFRVKVTPLTTLLVRSDYALERFDESSDRDTNGIAALAGFELRPSALIAGTALIGARTLTSVSGSQPDFTGIVASVDVSYIWRDTTKLGVLVERNTEPSLESDRPYYVLTDLSVSATQALGVRWDLVGRAGRKHFDYRARAGSGVSAGADRVESVGMGAGMRTASDVRVGFDMDYYRRRSDVTNRPYEGFRFGGSVTYGN